MHSVFSFPRFGFEMLHVLTRLPGEKFSKQVCHTERAQAEFEDRPFTLLSPPSPGPLSPLFLYMHPLVHIFGGRRALLALCK